LRVLAERHNVQIFCDESKIDLSSLPNIDIVLVASYPKKIPIACFAEARYAFNVHPSLLPNYRGANPYFWVIRNGESYTGVSIHVLTERVDEGRVLLKYKCAIDEGETQGSLRYKLARLARFGVSNLLELIKDRSSFTSVEVEPEIPRNLVYARKIKDSDRIVDPHTSKSEYDRIYRALYPYPGVLR
jgi:methionyl-tRNA formyltransferase